MQFCCWKHLSQDLTQSSSWRQSRTRKTVPTSPVVTSHFHVHHLPQKNLCINFITSTTINITWSIYHSDVQWHNQPMSNWQPGLAHHPLEHQVFSNSSQLHMTKSSGWSSPVRWNKSTGWSSPLLGGLLQSGETSLLGGLLLYWVVFSSQVKQSSGRWPSKALIHKIGR